MSNGYLLLGKDVQEMRDDGDYISFVWICHMPFHSSTSARREWSELRLRGTAL